jgi:hypothetical protein
MPPGAQQCPGECEDVIVTIDIPPLAEFPAQWAERDGCPHARISMILGAEIAAKGGVPVIAVEPDMAADKAGVKPGDCLGEPGDCPASLYESFVPCEEARTVEWTVRRRNGMTSESPAAESPAAPEELDATDASAGSGPISS